MQVKTRLQINVAFSAISALIVVIVVLLALYRVNTVREEFEIAAQIVNSVFERNTFKDDYLRSGNERAKEQWFAKNDQIGRLLELASERFKYPEEKGIIEDMTRSYKSSAAIFSNIIKDQETRGAKDEPDNLAALAENRFATLLSMQSYDLALNASTLRDSASHRLSATLSFMGWGIVGLIAIASAAAITMSLFLIQIITHRISRLRDGVSVISEGNLDYKINLKGDDEFAKLSGEFNNMAEKRKQAEKEREITIEFLRLVNASTGTRDLVRTASTFFQEKSGCEAFGIRLKEGDDYPYYEARGFSKEFIMLENSLCSRDIAGQMIRDSVGNPVMDCMCGNVICGRFDPSRNFFTDKGSFWATSTTGLLATTTDADRQTRTRNRCNGEGYESVALIPLRTGNERLGLIQLNDRRKGLYSPAMIALWERLSDYLAVALAKFRSDEALRESEAKYRNLFENMTEEVHFWKLARDKSGQIETWRLVDANPPTLKTWGKTSKEIMGKTTDEIFGPGATEHYMPVVQKIFTDGKPYCFVDYFPNIDKYFQFTSVPMGEYFMTTGADITGSKRAEEALRESEAKFRTLFETMTEGFSLDEIILDDAGKPVDLRYLSVNPAFELHTGLKAKDIEGRTVHELFPDAEPVWVERYGKVALTGEPAHFEERFGPLNRWFDVRAYQTKPGHFAVVFFDVTERKLAETVLREREAMLRAVLDQMPSGVTIRDARTGALIQSNVRSQEIMGDIVDGQYQFSQYRGIHADGRPYLAEDWPVSRSMVTGEVVDSEEVQCERSDGTLITISISSAPVRDSQGEIIMGVGVLHDITERKRAGQEIKRLNDSLLKRNRELEFANKEMESFIYSVSHDLRGPLRHIYGFSEILMKHIADKIDEKEKRHFSRIQDGTEKMSRLIDDLLKLSRIARQEMQRKSFDLSEMASSIIADLREADPDRSVKVDIKSRLEVFADPGLIEIALSNLLPNAWKFTKKTEHARIELGTMDQDGMIIYYVRDNGAGFDQQFAEKMFRPFHRLHLEEDFEGTGIGLAIVERIIIRHGGKVWAEGEVGKGATIYFSIK